MGQNAQFVRANRAVISIDWMLLVVAVIIFLFCLGAFIRITTEPQALRHQNGLLALSSDDALLAFNDFSFGSNGWSANASANRLPDLGPVLGPFSDDRVGRDFQLPIDTQTVRASFDLHLRGAWSEADTLQVALGEDNVVLIAITEHDNGRLVADIEVLDGANIDVSVTQTQISMQATGSPDPGTHRDTVVCLNVALQTNPTNDVLSLGLAAQSSDGASWTLDNLAVVATTDGEA